MPDHLGLGDGLLTERAPGLHLRLELGEAAHDLLGPIGVGPEFGLGGLTF